MQDTLRFEYLIHCSSVFAMMEKLTVTTFYGLILAASGASGV